MSTVAEKNGKEIATAKSTELIITYVPLGETEEINLTVRRVKEHLCVPTKSGKYPTESQMLKYIMLCKAQSLNPWLDDAYLVGYDSQNGPTFSLITAHKAFLKRAEASKQYDGMESGVIVLRNDTITERPGDLTLKGEVLVGGWARVHRKDRSVPDYDALNLENFDKKQSQWNSNKAGMIVKCAEVSALRKAFPSTLAAMYCKEEMERLRESDTPQVDTRSKTDRLAERLSIPVLKPIQEQSEQHGIDAESHGDDTEPTKDVAYFEECIKRASGKKEVDYIVEDMVSATLTEAETSHLMGLINEAAKQ